MKSVARSLVVIPCLLLAACQAYPPPTAPQPALDKTQVKALAKCQSTVKKAQLGFVKIKLATLGACVDGVLNLRLAFENGVATQTDYDAGLAKMRGKCTKGYAKITAASTKLVDAVIKSCSPVEPLVFGPYDGLRFQSEFDTLSLTVTTVVQLAGTLCTLSEETVDAQLWHAAPRMMELLAALGPEFVEFTNQANDTGFPKVPLDPRCLPLLAP